MEMQRKIIVGGDRLSDLPESILLHILSMISDGKQVVRTSVLSTRWRFLWKFVPVSLNFDFSYFSQPDEQENKILDFVISTHRDLHYWRSCQKIQKLSVVFDIRQERFIKDVDLWVYFATNLANVEEFDLDFLSGDTYQFPQFAYKNTSLRNMVLQYCTLNPSVNVNWSGLISLSLRYMNLMEGVMEKVIFGCPNLECLELSQFGGFHHLEINNVKLRKLIIDNSENDECDVWLEILAPYIQTLKLLGSSHGIYLRSVASLITADLYFDFDFEYGDQLQRKESSCLKKLLHSVVHAKNIELGPCCIEFLAILELEGWQPPVSSWKFVQLNTTLEELIFPRICKFLESSSDLETLVIDECNYRSRNMLSKYTKEDEQSWRFETHNFNRSFLHLKTIKIISFYGPIFKNKSVLSLVKYLLKHATVLEKFVIAAKCKKNDVSQDNINMKQDLLNIPRSSPHASVVFSYCKS